MSRKEDLQDIVNNLRKEGRTMYRQNGIEECKVLKQKLDNLDVVCKTQEEIQIEKLPNLQPREYVWQHLDDNFVGDIVLRVNHLKAYKKMMMKPD